MADTNHIQLEMEEDMPALVAMSYYSAGLKGVRPWLRAVVAVLIDLEQKDNRRCLNFIRGTLTED
jgi:hypothetical protein